MKTWQLQHAKARLSELIDETRKHGPQAISQRGVRTVVVVPAEQWDKTEQARGTSLLDVLRSSPEGELPMVPRKTWSVRSR
jgi:prevent-host-death family protein